MKTMKADLISVRTLNATDLSEIPVFHRDKRGKLEHDGSTVPIIDLASDNEVDRKPSIDSS